MGLELLFEQSIVSSNSFQHSSNRPTIYLETTDGSECLFYGIINCLYLPVDLTKILEDGKSYSYTLASSIYAQIINSPTAKTPGLQLTESMNTPELWLIIRSTGLLPDFCSVNSARDISATHKSVHILLAVGPSITSAQGVPPVKPLSPPSAQMINSPTVKLTSVQSSEYMNAPTEVLISTVKYCAMGLQTTPRCLK